MPRRDWRLGARSAGLRRRRIYIAMLAHEVGIDGTVLLFALGVSVLAGLACGLTPASWQSHVEARGELARETSLSAPGSTCCVARAGALCWSSCRLAWRSSCSWAVHY